MSDVTQSTENSADTPMETIYQTYGLGNFK